MIQPPAIPLPDDLDFDAPHDLAAIDRLLASHPAKVVVLDDDPTGAQTMHDVDVLTEWSVPALVAALREARPCFFILTNTRAMPAEVAVRMNGEIAANLAQAARQSGCNFTVLSRSDSTLRGHFPTETDVWLRAFPATAGVIVVPAFIEGGRFTIEDVHYLREGGGLVPVAETEFARDLSFGYSHSHLPRWIEEKTGHAVRAGDVVSISREMLRTQGATAVARSLRACRRGATIVVNASSYGDLAVFAHALMLVEAEGRRFVVRTAASFVRARTGAKPRAPLETAVLAGPGRGVLVVIGSYVPRSTAQLETLLELPGLAGIELKVGALAAADGGRAEIARASAAANAALGTDRVAVVYTSRELNSAVGRAGELGTAGIVSAALVEVVRAIEVRPRWVLAKGGITSSDVAVHGFGLRRARVLGQIAPGVSVWRLDECARFPGLPYVVFPGNVGDRETMREIVQQFAPAT
jgi:uncharacterized protein YgbK (DUF1537 family)